MPFRAKFLPRFPEKYVGDVNNIFARSSWEVTVMKFFDSRPDIIKWGSEEVVIPYLSPADNKIHRYFPDFFIEYRNADGEIKREIVEVKPHHESEAIAAKSQRSKDALLINVAKWKSASIYCETRGMTFRVITEKSIYHQGVKAVKKKKAK